MDYDKVEHLYKARTIVCVSSTTIMCVWYNRPDI